MAALKHNRRNLPPGFREATAKQRVFGIVVCCKTCGATLEDQKIELTDLSYREVIDLKLIFARNLEWITGREGNRVFVQCPSCFSKQESKSKGTLLPFAVMTPCPMCGNADTKMRFCDGRDLRVCDLNAVRPHFHRTCERCGHGFVQACLAPKEEKQDA